MRSLLVFVLTLLVGASASIHNCEGPYTCTLKTECKAKQRSWGGPKRVLFPCDKHRKRVCCPNIFDTVGELSLRNATVPIDGNVTTTTPPAKAANLKHHANFPLIPQCLSNDIETATKITNGEIALRGQFPWMALLFFEDVFNETTSFVRPYCGGSIINNRYILTAAHCFDNRNRTLKYIRLGEHNFTETCNEENESLCPQNFDIEQTIIHKDYNNGSLKNDIALVRVKENIIPNDNPRIAAICLPFDYKPEELNETGTFTAVGWGKTDWFDRDISDILRFVRMNGAGRWKCNICIVADKLCPLNFKTQLCLLATETGLDVCEGDSGGPLVVGSAVPVQVGITSFKTDVCGAKDLPSIYTRVDGYLSWILDNIKE